MKQNKIHQRKYYQQKRNKTPTPEIFNVHHEEQKNKKRRIMTTCATQIQKEQLLDKAQKHVKDNKLYKIELCNNLIVYKHACAEHSN